jgi:acetyl esterase
MLSSQGGGDRELELRTYTPEQGPFPKPVIVYYHGGGWVVGSPATHEKYCQFLAHSADCVVVSVDYRCAPEYRCPLPAEDAIDAYLWVRDHAERLAGHPAQILVGGDSAGGNLAAVVAQQAVVRGLPLPAGQLLIYPSTDMRRSTPSFATFAEGFVLTRAAVDFYIDAYIDGPARILDPVGSPLLAAPEVMAALPPAIIVTAGFDPLRDEGEAYARALQAQGVNVSYLEFCHLLHGFVSMLGISSEAQAANQRISEQVRSLIETLGGGDGVLCK